MKLSKISPKLLNVTICMVFLVCSACSTDAMDTVANPDGTDNPGGDSTADLPGYKEPVGDSSADLLQGDSFGGLTLQLFYVAGLRPTDATVDALQDFLLARLNKPDGITLILQQIDPPGAEVYSATDIRNIEDDIRTQFATEGNLAVFGIFLDGEYEGNTENGSVLGLAYRNTSFAIFGETIREFSGQPLAPATSVLETTVVNHEFGHLMGLVNAGTPLENEHQDTENGRHCTTEDCLMYWTAETGEGLINMISGGTVPSLDDFCIQDLQANGGR